MPANDAHGEENVIFVMTTVPPVLLEDIVGTECSMVALRGY